jgi:CBS domain containing-hemolysin-like protein
VSALAIVLFAVWLVLANGFFVAVECSLVRSRVERLEQLQVAGLTGAGTAVAAVRDPARPLATSQLGISVVSVLLGWAIAPLLGEPVEWVLEQASLPADLAAPAGLVAGLLLVTLVHFVVGEVVPRTVALAAPERTAALLCGVHRVVVVGLRPAVAVLFGAAARLARLLGADAGAPSDARTSAELAELVGESMAGGALDDAERDLLAGAFAFAGVVVGDVMARRDDLVTVPDTATVRGAEALVLHSGHSRVLVVGGDDQVIGFLHVKDLIALEGRPDDLLPPGLVRVALRVQPDDGLDAVLLRMRRARRHVAVVIDPRQERDQLVGLVTLEDILEAIVGDIRDESDRAEGPGAGGGDGPTSDRDGVVGEDGAMHRGEGS